MSGSTSGTVSMYPYNTARVIDHAMRRAGRAPEKASAEDLQIALDNIFSITSEWINAGYPLWTRENLYLPITQASPTVPLPSGTLDVFKAFWRQFNPWRGAAQLQTGADASALFSGQPVADTYIVGPGASVAVNFGGMTEVDTIGVLPGRTGPLTSALLVQVSNDGQTWWTAQTLPQTTFQALTWTYFDLNPSLTVPYMRLAQPVAAQPYQWVLNQLNFGLANATETQMGTLSQDDYYNLPNRQFEADRPNSYFLDRQIVPVMNIWPCPSAGAFYNGTVRALVRRYIQDPGALIQNVEVPQRWLEALQWRLATNLIYELPDPDPNSSANYFGLMAKQQRIQQIEAKATKAEALMWAEERNRAPIRWVPNLSAYTR